MILQPPLFRDCVGFLAGMQCFSFPKHKAFHLNQKVLFWSHLSTKHFSNSLLVCPFDLYKSADSQQILLGEQWLSTAMHSIAVQCSTDGGPVNISQCEKGLQLLRSYIDILCDLADFLAWLAPGVTSFGEGNVGLEFSPFVHNTSDCGVHIFRDGLVTFSSFNKQGPLTPDCHAID